MADPIEKKIDISHNPDMCIVAGVGTKKLYVNSAILTAASTVFRVMFGPNFAEGASLRTLGKMHCQLLPEDDEEATLLVMAILHRSWIWVPASLPEDSMFNLAKFAHKYDLVGRVRLITCMRWSTKRNRLEETALSNAESRRNFELMAAAYVLGLSSKFNTHSNRLILAATGLSEIVASKEALDYLPSETLDLLDVAQMDLSSKTALLYEERATRCRNRSKSSARTDEAFFYHKGRPSTIGEQLIKLRAWGLRCGDEIDTWFKQGLTLDWKEGTVTWEW